MARYDESYDGPYNGPRGGWQGDRFPRGRELTPFPEMAPPSFSGGPGYDRGPTERGYDRGFGGPGGYDREFGGQAGGGYDRAFWGARERQSRGGYGADFARGPGGPPTRFGPGQPRGFGPGPYATPPRRPDGLVGGRGQGPRGEYGGAYEAFGGRPGGRVQGESYGRGSQQRGYDAGYAREPFLPEEAYRQHPEYQQPRHAREWEAHQRTYGLELTDDQVRSAVQRRMSADAWLDPAGITVQVDDGVVTLTGEVDDYLKARYAWDDAWEAEGVRGVVNNLTVRADQPAPTHGDVLPQSAGGATTADEASGSI